MGLILKESIIIYIYIYISRKEKKYKYLKYILTINIDVVHSTFCGTNLIFIQLFHWMISFPKALMDFWQRAAAEWTSMHVCNTSKHASLCAVDLVINRPPPAVPRCDFLGLGERVWIMLLETGPYVFLRNPKCRLACPEAHKAKQVSHCYADLTEICQTAGRPVLSLSINHWNESMREHRVSSDSRSGHRRSILRIDFRLFQCFQTAHKPPAPAKHAGKCHSSCSATK